MVFSADGGDGADVLIGSDGADTLKGGAETTCSSAARASTSSTAAAGDNVVIQSVAVGTPGNDIGVGDNHDVIQDFAGDVIALAAVDANLDAGGDQAFSFIGTERSRPPVSSASSRMAPEIPSSKVTWTTTWAQTSRSRCTTSPDSCTPATSCSDQLGKNGVGGAKAPPLSFWRWHGRLLDCPPPPLFGNRHRRARDVAIHATSINAFCARPVADPTSEQAPPVRCEQSRYRAAISAAQCQSRGRRGDLQRILKEIPRGPQPRLKPGFSSGAKHRPQVLGHGRRWRLNRPPRCTPRLYNRGVSARSAVRKEQDNGCHRIL